MSSDDRASLDPPPQQIELPVRNESLLSYRIGSGGSGRVPPELLRLRNVYSATPKSPTGRPQIETVAHEADPGHPESSLGLAVAEEAEEKKSSGDLWLSRSEFQAKASIFEQDTLEHLALKRTGWGNTLLLAYFTIGTIYGDIGTSPLYTVSSILGTLDHTPTELDLLGAASLCFWFLTLFPLIKYVFIVLFFDDLGEGGTFAVYSNLCRHARISLLGSRVNKEEHDTLIRNYTNASTAAPSTVHASKDNGATSAGADKPGSGAKMVSWLPRGSAKMARKVLENSWVIRQALLVLALLGTCGVLADGVLTPAISVLSAVQGLGSAGVNLSSGSIVGITCAILVGLFSIQRFGTAKIAFTFSPVVLLWFFMIASIGIYNIASHLPGVFKAISPWYSFNFLTSNGFTGWVALGQVLLAITGSEALFADMGHFSRTSIQIAFSFVVYPSVVLAYFGQVAYASQHLDQISTLFYSSFPSSLFWPAFVIATGAAIVASQAMITGAFSIIKQSMILSCFPKTKVIHTSERKEGQIYIPVINWTLMVLTVAVVAGFQNGTAIGNAYGVTVVMVMFITTCLVATAMMVSWDLSLWLVVPFWLFYGGLEGVVFTSTLYKVPQGAWFTLAVAFVLMALMYTWHFGTYKKKHFTKENELGEELLYPLLRNASCVDGAAVVYSEIDEGVPPVLVHYLSNVPALQQVVICLTVKLLPLPRLDEQHRMLIAPMACQGQQLPGFYRVIMYYGYSEKWKHDPEFLERLRLAVAETIRQRETQREPGPEEEAPSVQALSAGAPTVPVLPHDDSQNSALPQGERSERRVWQLPAPGMPSLIAADKELENFNDAWEYNQVFFMGRTTLRCDDDARVMTRIFVPLYSLLKGFSVHLSTLYGVPTDRLLEVGMVYAVN